MAICFRIPLLPKSRCFNNPLYFQFSSKSHWNSFAICCSQSDGNENTDSNPANKLKSNLSEQSSWEAKDSEGKDYLYRLGAEADNMNIAVGARAGVIDDLFSGNFLGKDSDIVFDYRQKVTRSFEYLQGDYYIAPVFLDKVVCHIVKNYISHIINAKVPLILGVWGGKGQGKTFQTELIFRAMGIEPVIMSAGELESERAGEPGKLIRERYRTASKVVQNQGKMSCLLINDIDAGLGRFGNTQLTVNNQIVVGTLMNISDNPTRVSVGQVWRETDTTHRIPIIVTGNDLTTIYAPLIRDGRMDKFYWYPLILTILFVPEFNVILTANTCNDKKSFIMYIDVNFNDYSHQNICYIAIKITDSVCRHVSSCKKHPSLYVLWHDQSRANLFDVNSKLHILRYRQPTQEDIVNIVYRMYEKDGIKKDEVISIVEEFPNQALDFYGALRSRTYDRSILEWVDEVGGAENLGKRLLKQKKDGKLPVFTAPKQTVEALLESGYDLVKEQKLILENKLSKEYMKNMGD